HERDRKAKYHQQYKRLYHPFWRMKRRQNGRTNLDNKPADDRVGDGNLVNVAPLQLGKEVIDLHGNLSRSITRWPMLRRVIALASAPPPATWSLLSRAGGRVAAQGRESARRTQSCRSEVQHPKPLDGSHEIIAVEERLLRG